MGDLLFNMHVKTLELKESDEHAEIDRRMKYRRRANREKKKASLRLRRLVDIPRIQYDQEEYKLYPGRGANILTDRGMRVNKDWPGKERVREWDERIRRMP